MIRKTVAILLLLWTMLLPAGAKIYCLFTGVSNYRGDTHDLKVSTDDAKRLTAFYRNRGATVQLLTGKYATSDNILAFIDKMAKVSKPEDQVVFFFSGHGRNNCFITYDEEKCLYYAALYNELRKVQCSNIVIFMDACFSGSMYQYKDSEGNDHLNADLEANVGNNEKLIIFSSSRNDEKSYESRDGGLFTDAVLHGLQGAADADRNREITTIELFAYIKKVLDETTKNANFWQNPTLTTNKEKNLNVVLMKYDESTQEETQRQ